MEQVLSVNTNLDENELLTIRSMITYMLTEDESKVDSEFASKLMNLDKKFEYLVASLN